MKGRHLSEEWLRQLKERLTQTKDAPELRRIIGILAMTQGMPVMDVACWLGVTRQCVYQWYKRLKCDVPVPNVLCERPKAGRPSFWDNENATTILRVTLQELPDKLGYPAVNWTVGLLQEHIEACLGLCPSEETVRRQLHRLGYVWKRPRYVLDPDPEREKKTRFAAPFQAVAERSCGSFRG